jgi:hypothetical protein
MLSSNFTFKKVHINPHISGQEFLGFIIGKNTSLRAHCLGQASKTVPENFLRGFLSVGDSNFTRAISISNEM